MTDHIGYYSKDVPAVAQPTTANYHEEYPHMVSAYVYSHHYLDSEFDYEDLEQKYLEQEAKSTETPAELKQKLDQARNMQ